MTEPLHGKQKMITTQKEQKDLLKRLSTVPKRLYSRMFRRCDFFYSEHTDRWTCTIEFGFGHRIFGTGKSPHRALSEVLKQVDEMLKEGQRNE